MTEFAREYGEGLYDLASEEHLEDQILTEVRVLRDSFREEPDFLRLLSNRALGIKERLAIIDQTFSGRVQPYLMNFLKILCERDALHEFSGCVQVYIDRYNDDSRVAVAEVTTASALTDEQRSKLIDRLKKMTGKRIVLNEKVDETLLGGVLLEMDGHRWDNTLRKRLNEIRDAVAGKA